MLVMLDPSGAFIEVRLIELNEPIFVPGLDESLFHKVFEQDSGQSVTAPRVVGNRYGEAGTGLWFISTASPRRPPASASRTNRRWARRRPWRARAGWHRLTFGTAGIRPALTFSGIAQGLATDLAAAELRARGFDHVLIDIGEHVALGGPFTLEVDDPGHGLLAAAR